METRINKYLAQHGIASRRAIDELIAKRKIEVNGVLLTEPGAKVSEKDVITIDGKRMTRAVPPCVYVFFNKPRECITTVSDTHGRKTVLDYIQTDVRLFPIGRLDKNTTGALLLTNDGEMAHILMHPRHVVEKVYHAKLDVPFQERDKKRFEEGIMLDKRKTAPCQARYFHNDKKDVIVTLHEGRNRQIHRMFNALGYTVKTLDRLSYAGLDVGRLKRGEWRYLREKEVARLKSLYTH
jgi:23S rRNA pseudouridine2605 synthase/16S rRNA pseudouridine516 synthase